MALVVTGLNFGGGPASASGLRHLRPGQVADLRERLPITYVMVGIEPEEVPAAFTKDLPSGVETRDVLPLVRERNQLTGISYDLEHRVVYADAAYERRFFDFLASASSPAPVTAAQRDYTKQAGVLDIIYNHEISAPAVERWLAENPPTGVDPARNTAFFIDWHGQPGFRFHVYDSDREDRPAGSPMPNPRVPTSDHGPTSRKLIAYGGTAADDPEDGRGLTRRIWFYDFSAGPDTFTGNWNIEGGSNGIIPNSWEYGRQAGVRSPEDLSHDITRLARYVAINGLFARSPLYPASLTPPALPDQVEFDINLYGRNVGPIQRPLDPKKLTAAFEALAPWLEFSVDVDEADPADARHAACLVGIAVPAQVASCYPEYAGYSNFANPYLHHAVNRAKFIDNPKVYEAAAFIYQTPLAPDIPCVGYADDDYRTGTQSFVFVFALPSCENSLSANALLTHEYGHHLGMAHPHDGYDPETGVYSADNFFNQFIWAATEVNSVMSYLHDNDDFGQFDQDNSARWWTAAYVTQSNVLAERFLVAGGSTASLANADWLVGAAAAQLAGHGYRAAVFTAKRAYEEVKGLATRAGVKVVGGLPEPSSAATAAYPAVPVRTDVIGEGGFVRQ